MRITSQNQIEEYSVKQPASILKYAQVMKVRTLRNCFRLKRHDKEVNNILDCPFPIKDTIGIVSEITNNK
jgi:hypothetical protein